MAIFELLDYIVNEVRTRSPPPGCPGAGQAVWLGFARVTQRKELQAQTAACRGGGGRWRDRFPHTHE